MPIIKLKTPDGKTINLNAPDGATPEQIQQFAAKAAADYKAKGGAGKGVARKAWDALAVPERMSREGLTAISNAIPETVGGEMTGNLPMDLAKGTPNVIAETLAETAPGFVSRGAILTAGAARGLKAAAPVINAAGRGIARGAESISGLEYKTPGILQEAVKDSGLIFRPGRKAARPLYEAAKSIGGKVRESIAEIPEKIKVVKKALRLANAGKLNPTEALEARKELSAIKKSVSGEFFRKATEKFNEIVKPVFGKADEAFERGMRGDELRRIFPVNKTGGTSIMKSTLGTIAGLLPAVAMSPAVQGLVATGTGAIGRNLIGPLASNPRAAASFVAALESLTKNRRKR